MATLLRTLIRSLTGQWGGTRITKESKGPKNARGFVFSLGKKNPNGIKGPQEMKNDNSYVILIWSAAKLSRDNGVGFRGGNREGGNAE